MPPPPAEADIGFAPPEDAAGAAIAAAPSSQEAAVEAVDEELFMEDEQETADPSWAKASRW